MAFWQKKDVGFRRSARISTLTLARLFDTVTGELIATVAITDISAGGMQIETSEEIKAADEFVINFTLPNGSEVKNIVGKIMRHTKTSFTEVYGIKFIKIKFFAKMKIKGFIRKAARRN